MYEPQNFLDLHDDPNAAGADPKSWLSGGGGDNFSAGSGSPPPLNSVLSSLSAAASVAGNVDQRLLRDLVDMVPLVQSLIEQKQRPSFTRRGSMIYTKAPSKESLYKKAEEKGRNGGQAVPRKKQRDHAENNNGVSMTSRSSLTEKDREELISLREQVGDLQKKLSEKDELLKSLEITKSEMASVLAEVNGLKEEAVARESQLKSTQLQLSDTKIKLADKQAAVEKLEWEAMTSNKMVEKLQQDIDRNQSEISTMMKFFEGLQMEANAPAEEYDDAPYVCDVVSIIDDFDESKMQMVEEARESYLTAITAAKEKQDEESVAVAASARSHLQFLVMESNKSTSNGGSGHSAICY